MKTLYVIVVDSDTQNTNNLNILTTYKKDKADLMIKTFNPLLVVKYKRHLCSEPTNGEIYYISKT